MEQVRIFVQEVLQCVEIFLYVDQHVIINTRLLHSERPGVAVSPMQTIWQRITYPGRVSLLFHSGLTRRAKYRANPSRLPLNVAVPEPSPVEM